MCAIEEIINYDYKSEITIDDIIKAKNKELEIINNNSYLLSLIVKKKTIQYRKKDLREFLYFFDKDLKIENGTPVYSQNNAQKTYKKTLESSKD